eukprot:163233_1
MIKTMPCIEFPTTNACSTYLSNIISSGIYTSTWKFKVTKTVLETPIAIGIWQIGKFAPITDTFFANTDKNNKALFIYPNLHWKSMLDTRLHLPTFESESIVEMQLNLIYNTITYRLNGKDIGTTGSYIAAVVVNNGGSELPSDNYYTAIELVDSFTD